MIDETQPSLNALPGYRIRPARFLAAANWRLLVGGMALFGLFLALFAVVQYGAAGLAGNDGYYHARMGLLIRQQGLVPEFPWLPMTILNGDSYYDHHLLYHIVMALFTRIDPVVDGGASLTQSAKLASIVIPSLAFLAVWWLLRGLRVRWAAIWALGLFAVSSAFLYRMAMPRAQSASLLLLVLGCHFLFNQRYRLLIPLGFAYVWLYDAFPLLVAITLVYAAVTFATERRLAWQPVVFATMGIGLGLLVNPYFPENISFIISHLLPKIGDSGTRVGNEWYPYETWTLVENSGFALAAAVLGMLAWSWRKERIDKQGLTFFVLTLFFGFMLFRSRRFVEYFPAFALIFAAVSLHPLFGSLQDRLTAYRPRWFVLTSVGFLAILIVPLALTVTQARESISRSKPADQYAAAATWLTKNTPAGSMVFQTDWDDFPRLFFYAPNNLYTAGLDPTYMELHDADLYDTWRDITRGNQEQPGEIIRDRFQADYVFSDLKHDNFLEEAAGDPLLKEVYRDEYAVIFIVQS